MHWCLGLWYTEHHAFLCVFTAKERLYPVADATTFFTDMHYILRVLAAGDIRTVCHHRLNLLEQVIPFRPFSFKF